MFNNNINIDRINDIINKVISQIGSSRGQILDIVDNVRSESQDLKIQLKKVKEEIRQTIKAVDDLEKQDKIMRKKLVEVSNNFGTYSEEKIKSVYDEASEIRIKFITKQNEEKILRDKRTQLELSLKKCMKNIENAEKSANQIGIALGYLEGDMLSITEGTERNSEMFLGIKILEAQENERKRISRDIHDGPAQNMANIVMKADICEKIIKKDFEEGIKELQSLKESVRTALKEVRSIIFDLRPMSLDDLGLNQTIEETVNIIESKYDINVELRLKPIVKEVESIIQVAVYRIIQEIFNNIKKHSKAKNVELKLDYGTKYLRMVVKDDGIGFDVEETLKEVKTKGSSYGLIGILERINQLQGEISIESKKGSGTVFNVKLPVNRGVIKDEKQGN